MSKHYWKNLKLRIYLKCKTFLYSYTLVELGLCTVNMCHTKTDKWWWKLYWSFSRIVHKMTLHSTRLQITLLYIKLFITHLTMWNSIVNWSYWFLQCCVLSFFASVFVHIFGYNQWLLTTISNVSSITSLCRKFYLVLF